MDPGCSRRRGQRGGDLCVLEPLLRPQQEHLALQPRQLLQPRREQGFDFTRLRMLVRIAGDIPNAFIERHDLAPSCAPPKILQHISADRQQPCAKLAVPAKSIDAAKRADERFLNEIVHVGIGRSRPREKSCQGPGVTRDELGRGLFIPGLPRANQRGVAGRLGSQLRVRHRCRLSVDVGSGGKLRRCRVSGVRWLGLHPWEPDTRHRTPCHTGIRRIASDFEQSFETMRPYDERLDHLLARAARVFADKGYHPTTMRDLAAASGMSLAGMYYYVRGKEDLLALIQERCFTQVLEGARQAVAGASDPQEKLQAFIRHHVEFFANHMAEMKVLSHEASPRGVSAIKRRYVDLLESVLKDAAPEQGAVDRSAATYILFGMMNWIYNWYDPAGEIDPARLADLMASIFLGGFVETHQEAK